MKILHTSDWHLDHTLHNRRRHEEFTAFFDWLAGVLRDENVDILIVAGDIFNTRSPGVAAQETYFQFLKQVHEDFTSGVSRCRHVVITAGNHDSPAFLAAPKDVLRVLDVHVVTSVTKNILAAENPDEAPETLSPEVLLLENREKTQAAIVVAVPFLPARDIMLSREDESLAEKSGRLNHGIKYLYDSLLAQAQRLREQKTANYATKIPILTTGHLFTQGGKSGLESETGVVNGFRDLYVGNLEHFPADGFPDGYDYVALGHLHVPQTVGQKTHIRYSGSPLPINFSEATQEKEVVLIDFAENSENPAIISLPVPRFQPLCQVSGDMDEIQNAILQLREAGSAAWLEITYTGESAISDLEAEVRKFAQDSLLEVLCVRNRAALKSYATLFHEGETLENLDEMAVFNRRLAQNGIPEDEQDILREMFREILNECQS